MNICSFDCSKEPLVPGVSLLEASAGTGKTFALARIVLRLIAEQGLEISKILVVTFTTAATEELRGRIRELLVDACNLLQDDTAVITDETILELKKTEEKRQVSIRRIRLAITCFDEAIIETIHGFCSRVLTENSLETLALFEAELDQASDDLVVEAMQEYWRCNLADTHPVITAATSIAQFKPDDMVKFYRALPTTREYRFGFDQAENGSLAKDQLIHAYDQLRIAWLSDRGEYLKFVEQCVAKNMRAFKNSTFYAGIFDHMFREEAVSPIGLQTLEYVQASRLKVRQKFAEEPKPRFALEAEQFLQQLQQFGVFLRLDSAAFLKERIKQWKEARAILSFDDLLSLTGEAVGKPGSSGDLLRDTLRQSFDAALIDEFQDTDPVQFHIFRKLFAETNKHWLYLIGDPKQSIYRFRGADLEAYFSFARETGATVFSLDKNFRTTSSLVSGINAFLSAPNESPFHHSQLPFIAVSPNHNGQADQEKNFSWNGEISPPFKIKELQGIGDQKINQSDAKEGIRIDMANEIFRLLENGRIGNREVGTGDIAILVHSNFEAKEVWEYFRSRGLPAVVFTDLSLFETDEAKELACVLQGLANAHDDRAVRRALATGLLGKKTSDFQNWINAPELWDEWVGKFREFRTLWHEQGIYVVLRKLFRETGAIGQNLSRLDGERRVTNFMHLAEVLHQATSKNPMSPSSLVVWLRARMDEKDRSKEEYQLRLESESEVIRILTVHKAKGLEYPITFIPFLGFSSERRKGTFTYLTTGGELRVDLREFASEDSLAMGRLEERREDARLLYVALTRASSCCYLYQPALVSKEDEQTSTQGYIFNCIKQLLKEVPIRKWIDQQKLENSISHNYLSFPVRETDGLSNNLNGQERSESEILAAAEFPAGRSIPLCNRIESFSSLTKQVDFNGADLDSIQSHSRPMKKKEKAKDPIFEFPAGAHAGNFIHDVFEHLEFDQPDTWVALIEQKLSRHQFDSNNWLSTIKKMVGQVMEVELFSGFQLGSLSRSNRMEEMEFLFPSHSNPLSDLVDSLPNESTLHNYLCGISKSAWEKDGLNGFLTGKIDLIFRHNAKFYILDWKSNRLNGDVAGFGPNEIRQEMLSHHYTLQYHLYVLALHLHLRDRLPRYSYDRDFGGVYYLFTRGIRSSSNAGIFEDRPSLEVIEILERFFTSSQ